MLSAPAIEGRRGRHPMGVQMQRNIRRLFWVEIGAAAITGLLALITPIFPDWIELASG
jgi:hypothetical protein